MDAKTQTEFGLLGIGFVAGFSHAFFLARENSNLNHFQRELNDLHGKTSGDHALGAIIESASMPIGGVVAWNIHPLISMGYGLGLAVGLTSTLFIHHRNPKEKK